jgi:hypothetical protein
VYGPGYAGWNSSLSISGNLAKRRKSSSSPSLYTPPSVASAEAEGDLTTIVEREEQMEEVGCGYYDLVWTISDIFKVCLRFLLWILPISSPEAHRRSLTHTDLLTFNSDMGQERRQPRLWHSLRPAARRLRTQTFSPSSSFASKTAADSSL